MILHADNSFKATLLGLPSTAQLNVLEVIAIATAFQSLSDIKQALTGEIEAEPRGFTFPIKSNFQHVIGSLKAAQSETGELLLTIVLFD